MYWTILFYTFIGWVLILLGNLEAYSKSNVSVRRIDCYWNYMSINLLYMIASILSIIVISNLINVGALPFILNYFLDVDITKLISEEKMHIVNRVFAFVAGYNSEFFINLFRRIKKPVEAR